MKNENIIHQSYIPQEVFDAYTAVIKQMQDDISSWFDMAKLLFAGEYDEINYKKCETTVDRLLIQLAFAETKICTRLKQLSGDD